MDGHGAQPCYRFCTEEVHDDRYSVRSLLCEALQNRRIQRGFQSFHPGAKKVDVLLMSRGVMGRVKMIKHDDRLSHGFVDLTRHLSMP